MVAFSDILAANATLGSSTSRLTAVVVGCTNGIGRGFINQLTSNVPNPKIYIVGRSQAALSQIQSDLSHRNPNGTYVPIQTGDLTLISSVDAATRQIMAKETHIDILFMSAGYLTFSGRDESTEGLDKLTSIRYYARMRFILNLLPLLESATSPRVVSVLAGGKEGKVFVDDMDLRKPEHYGIANAGGMAATYTTLFMEQLQEKHPRISFVHSFPGLVRTNLLRTEHFGAAFKFFVNWIVMPTIGRLLFQSQEDAGARQLFAATSPTFAAAGHHEALTAFGSDGRAGSGVYTLDERTEPVQNNDVLGPYREDLTDRKIWAHTMGEYVRISGNLA